VKIRGEAPLHKRYRVMRDHELSTEVLGSFDTIEEAISHARTLRRDWQFVIRDHGRKIMWPETRRTP
jgi:hypothetical protein